MWGHPLTELVVVIIGCAAVSALFGLLKALRGPIGMLAYGGLILTLYAYYRMGDRYFSQGIWQISIACLVVIGFTLRRVPFLRITLMVALIEFGSRINRTAYPRQTVFALGLAAAMIAVATFWTPKVPKPVAPPERVPAAYRRPPGPQLFDPYTGRPLRRQQRDPWLKPSTIWRWTRNQFSNRT